MTSSISEWRGWGVSAASVEQWFKYCSPKIASMPQATVLDKNSWVSPHYNHTSRSYWHIPEAVRGCYFCSCGVNLDVQWERYSSQLVTQQDALCYSLRYSLWNDGLTFRMPSYICQQLEQQPEWFGLVSLTKGISSEQLVWTIWFLLLPSVALGRLQFYVKIWDHLRN